MNLRKLLLGLSSCTALCCGAVQAQQADTTAVPNIVVSASSPGAARATVAPDVGASTYTLDKPDIADQPQGVDRPFNDTLLQTPGFAQDSFGQLHLRNEHANLQFRINDIIIPEGISGLGQTFDSRFEDRIQILDGPLPARYGYRTSGIVDITTKTGVFDPGSTVDVYGGGDQTIEPSVQTGGNAGGLNYYATGTYLQNDLGVENPTASYHAIHDRSQQTHGFAYAADDLTDTLKLSAMTGTSTGQFQIPDNPDQPQQFAVDRVNSFSSANLNQRQFEQNQYGVVALKRQGDRDDFQIAPYVRYSATRFAPDPLGDLVFNGESERTTQTSTATGLQFDNTYRLDTEHTLGAGLLVQNERTSSLGTVNAFPATTGAINAFGNAQDSGIAQSFTNSTAKAGQFYGVYAQDEWRISQPVTLNYGLRFDELQSYSHENQVSPRLNVVYKPFAFTTLHAGYARNFTPPPQELVGTPVIAQLNGTTAASPITEASTVRAEREHSFEVGVAQGLAQGWDASLNAYYKIKRNLLDEGQFGESLVFSPFNYAFGKAYGVEGSTTFRFGSLTSYANIAIGQEKGKHVVSGQNFFSADELAYIDSHAIYTDHSQNVTASAGASYSFADSAGTLLPSLDMVFGSGLRSDPGNGVVEPNGTHLPPYSTLNFGLSQDFTRVDSWLNGFTVRFDIINLTDRSYEIRDGTGVGVGAPQYGQRLTFFTGVSRNF